MRLRCLLLVCWIYGSQAYPILMLLYIEALLEVCWLSCSTWCLRATEREHIGRWVAASVEGETGWPCSCPCCARSDVHATIIDRRAGRLQSAMKACLSIRLFSIFSRRLRYFSAQACHESCSGYLALNLALSNPCALTIGPAHP